MLFNTVVFFVFFLIVFAVYWRLDWKKQNIFVLLASYVFYGWWDWRFLFLLFFTTTLDFFVAKQVGKAASRRLKRNWLLVSIIANLSVLGFFKYFNFFVGSFAVVLEKVGFQANVPSLRIILPVGISFYTFQAMSYVIDVYRGKVGPARNWITYSTYVSFFPQLLAGPIGRGADLLPQFSTERKFDYEAGIDGARQILWGLFKKVAIADQLAMLVEKAYANPAHAPGPMLLCATYFFAIQIYCDFSGYSDMAIGMGKLLGIRLMQNFYYPYFSESIKEFWHRWHISLSSWFRDYFYIPLGGNRGTIWQVSRNLFLTFVVSGLWHGANWTFIVWGSFHGLILLLEDILRRAGVKILSLFGKAEHLLRILIVFHLALIGWVFFRSRSIGEAFNIIYRIMIFKAGDSLSWNPDWTIAVLSALFLVSIEWKKRSNKYPLEQLKLKVYYRWALYGFLIVFMFLLGPSKHIPFIYFQF